MIVYVTQDLMLGSRVKVLAQQTGIELTISPRLPDAQTLTESTRLVIIDLQAAAQDIPNWLPTAIQQQPQLLTVAYGPHVLGPLLDTARQAGVSQVMTRGQFDRQLPELLQQLAD